MARPPWRSRSRRCASSPARGCVRWWRRRTSSCPASRHRRRHRPRARGPAPRVRPAGRGRGAASASCRPLGLGQEIWAPDAADAPSGRRAGRTSASTGPAPCWWSSASTCGAPTPDVVRGGGRRRPADRDRSPGALSLSGRARAARRDAALAGDGRAAAGERGKLQRALPGSPPRVGGARRGRWWRTGLVDLVATDHHGAAAGGRLAAGGVRAPCAPAASRRSPSGPWWSGPGAVLRDEPLEEPDRRASGRQGQARSPDRLEQVAHRARLLAAPPAAFAESTVAVIRWRSAAYSRAAPASSNLMVFFVSV